MKNGIGAYYWNLQKKSANFAKISNFEVHVRSIPVILNLSNFSTTFFFTNCMFCQKLPNKIRKNIFFMHTIIQGVSTVTLMTTNWNLKNKIYLKKNFYSKYLFKHDYSAWRLSMSTKLRAIEYVPKQAFHHLWYYLWNCISKKIYKFRYIINYPISLHLSVPATVGSIKKKGPCIHTSSI